MLMHLPIFQPVIYKANYRNYRSNRAFCCIFKIENTRQYHRNEKKV